jgi:hypothetical protein
LDAERPEMKLHRSLLLILLFLSPFAHAHVGSKDVFEQATVGLYQLYVTVRMPNVIPGAAVVEVRSTGTPITGLRITPYPLTGEASKHPPASDPMNVSPDDPNFYTGSVWLMASGSWQIRFDIAGPAGDRSTSVPVAAIPISTLRMDHTLGTILAILGLFLILSMAGLVAAAIREARLQPGQQPDPTRRRLAIFAMVGSLAFMALCVYGGAKWWNVEAAAYDENIFKPLQITPLLTGNHLDLHVQSQQTNDPRDARNNRSRSNTDFIPDHGHLMHLYAIREPEMDAAFHLHPVLAAAGDFRILLPVMPPGQYTLYGDVVHANGFPETLVSKITIPDNMPGGPLGDEDASAHPQPLSEGQLDSSYKLPDGYVMVWDRPTSITANNAYAFRFRLLNADGKPAPDMQPYLGMAGHAAFVKTDGTVFAHTHPEGSAAMASLMLANGSDSSTTDNMDTNKMDMPMHSEPSSSTVEFPYGFPSSGRYRIFVQMKHGSTVETGVFDATVL